MLAVELSRRARRPVSLVFTRHEEQLVGGHRAATRQTVRLAADRDGTLVASELDCVIGMGAAGDMVPPVHGPAMFTYASANAHAMRFPVKLNLRPVNAFRGPGYVEGTTALRAGDRRARRRARARSARAAPAAARRPRPGQRPAVLGEVAAGVLRPRGGALGLGRPRGAARARRGRTGCCAGSAARRRSGSARRGRPSECTIRIGADGIATVVTGIQDIGTGTLTGAQIVAAEELGLPLEQHPRRRRRHAPERASAGRGRLGHDRERHAGGARGGGERAPRAARARRRALRDLAR